MRLYETKAEAIAALAYDLARPAGSVLMRKSELEFLGVILMALGIIIVSFGAITYFILAKR